MKNESFFVCYMNGSITFILPTCIGERQDFPLPRYFIIKNIVKN